MAHNILGSPIPKGGRQLKACELQRLRQCGVSGLPVGKDGRSVWVYPHTNRGERGGLAERIESQDATFTLVPLKIKVSQRASV
jgi:hypothetical protein